MFHQGSHTNSDNRGEAQLFGRLAGCLIIISRNRQIWGNAGLCQLLGCGLAASSLKVAAARVAVTRVVRAIQTFTCRQSETNELKARFSGSVRGRMAYVPQMGLSEVERTLS